MAGTEGTHERRLGHVVAVASALALGSLLRLTGIGFGLPDRFRPDEQYLVERAWQMGPGHGYNPRLASYPAGQTYAILAIARAAQTISGAVWRADEPRGRSAWYLTGRLAAAVLGIATIALAARLAAAMFGGAPGGTTVFCWAGSLAALLTAGAFLHARDSHFATTDVPMAFWVVAALVSLAPVLQRARWRDSLVGGALVGIATATKYPAATLLLPLALAHVVGGAERRGAGPMSSRLARLVVALLACVLVFTVVTPYTLLDQATTQADFSARARDLLQPGVLAPGSVGWLVGFALPAAVGLPLALLSIAATLWCCVRGPTLPRLVVVWLVTASVPLVIAQLVFLRYLVPLIPPLMALAAAAAVGVACGRQWALWSAAVVLLAALAPSLERAIAFDRLLREPDTRTIAREWMEANLPPRTRVYSPEYGQGTPFALPQIGGSGIEYAPATDDLPRGSYVLIVSHPLPHARRASLALADRLRRSSVLVLDVRPFRPGPRPRGELVYEAPDAFFVPLFGFGSVERPGPRVQIFRLSDNPRT